MRRLAVAGLVLAASTALAAEPPSTEPVPFPVGAIDSAGERIFLPGKGGGIDALDAKTGRVLWHDAAPATPLLAAEGKLYADAVVKNALVVRTLEAETGKVLATSQPLGLPGWALRGLGVRGPGDGASLSAHAWLEDGALLYAWEASTWYVGGAVPTQEVLAESNREARGVVRVDLESGGTEGIKGGTRTSRGAPVLPEKLDLPNETLGTPFRFGARGIAVVGTRRENAEQVVVLHRWRTGLPGSHVSVELVRGGGGSAARPSAEGSVLLVRDPKGSPTSFLLFDVASGKRLFARTIPLLEGGAARSGRVFVLELDQRSPYGASERLIALDASSGKLLWEHGVGGYVVRARRP